MVKGTPQTIAERRETIIHACETLYQSMSFKDITLKEIGNEVPFSRPTIYNYFQTKEEIFLALFEREYDRWNAELETILRENDALTGTELADRIARSLERRPQLLKLLSMNNFDMEANSRQERLTSFKSAYGKSLANVRRILKKFCPDLNENAVERFIYVFFPFLFGVYPYTSVTEKQRAAMRDAGVTYTYPSVYEIIRACIQELLGSGEEMQCASR